MVEAMEIPKGFKKTEIGIIPDDWGVIMLKKLLSEKLQNGVFFKPSSKGIGIKLINVGDLYKGFPINVDELELFDASVDEEKRYKVLDGDLFFTRSSVVPAGIAHCNIYANDMAEKVVFDSHVIKARPNKKIVSPFYLFRYCSYAARNYLVSHAKTAIMTTIDQGVIENCPIVLPPTKAEQTAIAEALNDADALIAELEKLIAKKKAIKQGAMQELLKPKEGWEVKKLGEIADIDKGEQLNRETLSDRDTYPVFNGGISPSGYTNKWNTEKGTIIISEGGNSCGYINFIKERFWRGGHCYQVKTRIEKEFLFHILKSQEKNIMALRVGSGLPNIQRGRLIGFELIIPKDENEQKKIAQILSDMDTEIEALEKKLDKYKMLKQGMMQNLLTGKIRLI